MGKETKINGCEDTKTEDNIIFQSNWFKTTDTFEDMDLDNELLASIVCDFKKPFLIQKRAIKPCIDEHDVIIEAPSGSGKTTAVAISILQLIDTKLKQCQALVLVPNIESALQVQALISILADYIPNFTCHVCDDQRSIIEEQRLFDLGGHVLVGTPESVLRLFAHDSQVKKNKIRLAVLDKVNELLVDKHNSQIYDLFCMHLCWCSQIVALSTTLPKELKKFKDDFMNETVQIILKKDDFYSFQGVKQFRLHFENETNKFDRFNTLRHTFKDVRILVFCNNRRNVDELTARIKHSGQSVLSMHVGSAIRENVIEQFFAGTCNVLVTTDFLGHGFKLPKSIIVNYDLPQNPCMYSARLGYEFDCPRNVLLVNFVTNANRTLLTKIEQFYHTCIIEMPEDCSALLQDSALADSYSCSECKLLSFAETHSTIEISKLDQNNIDNVTDQAKSNEPGVTPSISTKKRKKESDNLPSSDENNVNESSSEERVQSPNSCKKSKVNDVYCEMTRHEFIDQLPVNFFGSNNSRAQMPFYQTLVRLKDSKQANFIHSNHFQVMKKFSDIHFHRDLRWGIGYDFKKPLIAQQKVLFPCIEGYDILIEAPKGSGKTTAFIIAILHVIDNVVNECRAVILVHSFELIEQTEKILLTLSQKISNVKWYTCTNSSSFDAQNVSADTQIIICTPAHLYDVIPSCYNNTNKAKILVADEADKILFGGCRERMQNVFQSLSPEVQIILSTSVSSDTTMIRPFSRDFHRIVITKEEYFLNGIELLYTTVKCREQKFITLKDVCAVIRNFFPIILYCNTYRELNEIVVKLAKFGIPAAALKSDMNEWEFEQFYGNFCREGKRVLVTLDAYAMSVHFDHVSFVINFSMPFRCENYVRRIQRNGKFAKKMKVVNILFEKEKSYQDDLKTAYNVEFTEILCPFTVLSQ